MSELDDIAQISRSPETRSVLDELEASKKVANAVDGFRLAVSLAIAFGCTPDVDPVKRQARGNWIAASGLDTGDSAIKTVVRELFPEVRGTPYRAVEDLGEQGARLIREKMIGDELDLESLIDSVERL